MAVAIRAATAGWMKIRLDSREVNNHFSNFKFTEGGVENYGNQKTVWDLILKVVIAVASAIAGVVGANAMPL